MNQMQCWCRCCRCEGKLSPTSPGLSDLWAQHGCHRSSTRSPLRMFVYLHAPHPCLSLCLSVLLFSLWPSAVRPAAKGAGEGRGVGWAREGRRMERGGGGEEEVGGGGATPFIFPAHTPSASTHPCYIIHIATFALGCWWWRRFLFFGGRGAGLPPAERGPHQLKDAWFLSVVILCFYCLFYVSGSPAIV